MVSWGTVRLVVATVLLLVTGCGGPQRSVIPGSPNGLVTIVWLAGPTVRTVSDDVREVLVDAFEQSHPSIKVELHTGPDTTDLMRSAIISAVSSGAATPDVYSGDVIWPAQFAQAGLAVPISRHVPASFWTQFAKPGTPRWLVKAMSYRGQVYGIPYFIDEGFLYYRKDLLSRAHLQPPATWQQLVRDSEALRRDHLPYQFVWQGNNYEGLTCNWIEMLADAFGRPPTMSNLAAELASWRALKTLDFLRSLIHNRISPPNTDTFEETETDNTFDGGKAAFMRGWDSSYANALGAGSRIADPTKVGVMPPPSFQGESRPGWSVIGGWSIFINPHTQHLHADLTFATWMAGAQAQQILATQYSEVPSNANVRADPNIEAASPVLQAAAHGRLADRPSVPDYQQVTDAIHDHIWDALPGPGSPRLDPCLALIRAARAIDPRVHTTLRCVPMHTGNR